MYIDSFSDIKVGKRLVFYRIGLAFRFGSDTLGVLIYELLLLEQDDCYYYWMAMRGFLIESFLAYFSFIKSVIFLDIRIFDLVCIYLKFSFSKTIFYLSRVLLLKYRCFTGDLDFDVFINILLIL